jgi:hypothetical protein
LAATILFTTLPVLRLGPSEWSHQLTIWLTNATNATSRVGLPAEVIPTLQTRNLSVRRVVASYLKPRSPKEGADKASQLGQSYFGDAAAQAFAGAAMLALVVAGAICSRGRVSSRDQPDVLWELAAVGVLLILLSPLTWTQHCVFLIPGCYLVAMLLLGQQRLPTWIAFVLCAFALVCSLAGRDVAGRRIDALITQYGLATFCMVGLFIVLLAAPRVARAGQQ